MRRLLPKQQLKKEAVAEEEAARVLAEAEAHAEAEAEAARVLAEEEAAAAKASEAPQLKPEEIDCSDTAPAPTPAGALAPAEPVVATYKCLKKSQVRVDFEMASAKACILKAGTVIEAFEVRSNDLGVNRVRYSKGWVSEVTGGGDTALELVETKYSTEPGPDAQPDEFSLGIGSEAISKTQPEAAG